jgi:hypothetical protein
MTAFATHMQALAKDFIGTVLFVDDQFDDKPISINTSDETTIGGNQQKDNPLENAAINTEELQEPEEFNAPVKKLDDSHILKIKELSQAFSANDILYSPIYTEPISTKELQDTFVAKVCRLANKADVIVLDWQMEAAEGAVEIGTTAQLIIAKYKSDNPDRDILVCIFTAETEGTVNATELCNGNIDVFYVSKKVPDACSELPNMIVSKFAKRHEGILPSVALSSIKVIRDNTHRILARFSSDNDAAYLSHRSLIGEPSDAEIFATELLAGTFGDLIRGNAKVSDNVKIEILEKWLEARATELVDSAFKIDKIDGETDFSQPVNMAVRKQWLKQGILSWVKLLVSEMEGKTKKLEGFYDWEKTTAKSLVQYFKNGYDDKKSFADEAAFARLTSLAMADIAIDCNSLHLTVGTILKSADKYYLCIQPLCDSVRLKADSNFLFISLEVKPAAKRLDKRKDFNLIAYDNADVFLKVDEKISKLLIITFNPTGGTDRILIKNSELITGKLLAQQDLSFTFVAQLRHDHARRIAANFVQKITRIGLDESEWLRRHGTA